MIVKKRIDNFITKFHDLHETSYKNPDEAGKVLNQAGARKVKTIPREETTTRVYKHPKFGTFTSVEDIKRKKTKILHYPMPKAKEEKVYLESQEKPPEGKQISVGPRGGRFYRE